MSSGDDRGAFTLQDAFGPLEFWKDFDLDTNRLNLDKSCVEMREMKTASINGRKKLNEATKVFRSKTREEQVLNMTELLKLYQDEIDQLSNRSKYSEKSFYNLYKQIYDAPNPATAMEGLIGLVTAGSTNSLEIERLKAELTQYDEEFQQLKNQDITIRRLEEQLQEYRDKIEDKVMEEVMKRTVEVENQAEAHVTETKEVARASERRLAAAVESMRQAQASADRAQTQMFEISSQAEESVSALLAENGILAEGSERLQARVAELEGEIEILKNNMNNMGGLSGALSMGNTPTKPNVGTGGNISDDNETLQMVVNDLRQEIRKKEESFRGEKQRLESVHREVSQQLAREKEALSKVKLELAERPTKDDLLSVRRQLKMLQRVAFNVEDEDHDGDGLDPENTLGEKLQLEVLLTTRMKSLESDLSDARQDLREAKKQEAAAKEAASILKANLDVNVALVARLESDLETHLQGARGNTKGGMSGSSNRLGGQGGDGHMDLSELLGVDMTTGGGVTAGGTGEKDIPTTQSTPVLPPQQQQQQQQQQQSSQQMVNILQAQRDRYKERLSQTESSMLSTQQRLTHAETAKMQLEQDNLALYAKIRYLQSMAGSGGGGSSSSSRGAMYGSKGMSIRASVADEERGYGQGGSRRRQGGYDDDGMEDDDYGARSGQGQGHINAEVESRYGLLYEQKMNPFAQFSQIEKQRRLQELSVADRIVLNTTMAFVSTQTGRTFLVVYLSLMHLLVFFVIYWNTHTHHHGCDPALDALHRGHAVEGHIIT